jgi:hypothetical protein
MRNRKAEKVETISAFQFSTSTKITMCGGLADFHCVNNGALRKLSA